MHFKETTNIFGVDKQDWGYVCKRKCYVERFKTRNNECYKLRWSVPVKGNTQHPGV